MAGATAEKNGNGASASAPAPAPAPAAPAPTPAPAPATADAPALTREQRKAQRAAKAAQQAAQAVKESRYTLDEGEEWHEVEGLGDAGVCVSKTGFYYVVFRGRGREHAIPLLVIEKLQETGAV